MWTARALLDLWLTVALALIESAVLGIMLKTPHEIPPTAAITTGTIMVAMSFQTAKPHLRAARHWLAIGGTGSSMILFFFLTITIGLYARRPSLGVFLLQLGLLFLMSFPSFVLRHYMEVRR